MITGARQATLSGLRRLVAFSMAQDLGVYLIPGPEIACAYGLDIEAAGMQIVASPRHASVLLVVGEISPALREAAAVVYAQMMRPRVLFGLDTTDLSPLPAADILAGISQQELVEGVRQLRIALAEGAFSPDVSDFDAPMLQTRIEYTCSMHPEIVRDEPGSCPKCGMTLIPREAQAGAVHTHTEHREMGGSDHPGMGGDTTVEYTCPMHPEVVQNEPGSCPKCGMNLEPRDAEENSTHEHHHMAHDTSLEYTCPMHPEVVQSEPGSCPKCGMNLEPRDTKESLTHEHHHMAHETPVEYTCPMHPEVVQNEPGSCPKCGMNLEPRNAEESPTHEHHHMAHETPAEYTCPMHPEVVQNEPGSCPKCGMNLEPRDVEENSSHEHHHMAHETPVEYTCPMHPEVVQNEPGSCPKCGMNLEPRNAEESPTHEHHHMAHETPVEYTCPMHPEVVQNEPGSCPKCGMNLEPREAQDTHHDHTNMDHTNMDHGDMDHGDMGFMSMIDVTKDLPRSGDGLPMDWIDAPFGPFFPGLPGGLLLTLTLDGDTVAGSSADTLVGNEPLLLQPAMGIREFTERLAKLAPLTPVCYQVLACLAIENAARADIDTEIARARAVAVERERIVSHLGWLALFGRQTGFDWLLHRATSLQRGFLHADIIQIAALKTAMLDLGKRLQRTPLLKSRTTGIGRLVADTDKILFGPVARASGINQDVRSNDKIYGGLGFMPASGSDGDVRARLQLRVDEINQSLVLIEKAGIAIDLAIGACHVSATNNIDEASGTGEAVIETPRGLARLQLSLEKGQVITAQLETPSTFHLGLIEKLTEQQELGDALVAIGSLDLSPWEIRS